MGSKSRNPRNPVDSEFYWSLLLAAVDVFHHTSHIFSFIYVILGSTFALLRLVFMFCGCSEGKNTSTPSKHAVPFLHIVSAALLPNKKAHQLSNQRLQIEDKYTNSYIRE